MKKILLENILPGIVILLIGTYVGVYVNTNKTNEENKIRFFDYQCYTANNMIQVPDINIINDIQIHYKDRIIENLTSISISIYNLSDKDYEDVPIIIDLTP